MATLKTLAYVHRPEPPFARIAGPIYPSSVQRETGLSKESSANLTLSAADIREEWVRPGACWSIDESDIGEPIWAGFCAEQEVPFQPQTVRVPLLGPKAGLLAIELAIRLPMPVSRAFAVEQALLQAQAQNRGMQPGDIGPSGAAVEIDVRGETIASFIESVKEASANADYRERVTFDGTELQFYLDFGQLQHPTDITLRADDIVDGLFTRRRVVASVTQMAQSAGFETRAGFSTAGRSRLGDQPTDSINQPLQGEVADLLNQRDIGPAAGRHVVEITERFGPDRMAEYATDRHLELLHGVDEIQLMLDATRGNVRRLQLGDVVTLDVPNWGLGIGFNQKMHVREITPRASEGRRDIIGSLIF